MKKNILVLCTGNSCRSQMAEGYLRQLTDANTISIYSAGIEKHGVNPKAIAIMQEDGVDISKHSSNTIDEYLTIDFDIIITVCDHAKEQCPFFASKAQKYHYNFPDPAKAIGTAAQIDEQFRTTRQLIKDYCTVFVSENLLNNK